MCSTALVTAVSASPRFFHEADMRFTAWLLRSEPAWLLRSEPAWLDLGDYDLEGQRFDYSSGFFHQGGMKDLDALVGVKLHEILRVMVRAVRLSNPAASPQTNSGVG
jgi:hypothetical protein